MQALFAALLALVVAPTLWHRLLKPAVRNTA
jgi:hypothetical protein